MDSFADISARAIRDAIRHFDSEFKGQWTFKIPEKSPLLFSDFGAWRGFLGKILENVVAEVPQAVAIEPDGLDQFQSKQLFLLQLEIRNKLIAIVGAGA